MTMYICDSVDVFDPAVYATRFGGISLRVTIALALGWLRGVIRLTSLGIARLTGRDRLDHEGGTGTTAIENAIEHAMNPW